MSLAGKPMSLLCALLALLSGLQADAAEPARVALLPLEMDAQTPQDKRDRFEKSLRQGLASTGIEIVNVKHRGCADTECRRALARDANQASAVVQGTVASTGRDYQLQIELFDAQSGELCYHQESSCEICTYTEAAEALGYEAAAMRSEIQNHGSKRAPRRNAAGTTSKSLTTPSAHRPAAFGRILGWSTLGLSVPFLVSGITLINIDENPYVKNCSGTHADANGTCEFRYDTMNGGIAMTTAGVASAVLGIILLAVDRRKTKRARKQRFTLLPGIHGVSGQF